MSLAEMLNTVALATGAPLGLAVVSMSQVKSVVEPGVVVVHGAQSIAPLAPTLTRP